MSESTEVRGPDDVAAELAAMRALSRGLETQLGKLKDAETQKRVLAWHAAQVAKRLGGMVAF